MCVVVRYGNDFVLLSISKQQFHHWSMSVLYCLSWLLWLAIRRLFDDGVARGNSQHFIHWRFLSVFDLMTSPLLLAHIQFQLYMPSFFLFFICVMYMIRYLY